MFDSAELRVHPTGKAILKLGVKSQGQGHETTFAQIVAEELGIPYEDVEVQEGDTDNTPYGLGTYASRSTPIAGAATAVISRKLRDKAPRARRAPARGAPDDLEWERGRFFVKGAPGALEDDPGRRLRRLLEPARRHGGGARGRPLLRPAEHDLPVRDLRRRGRDRPRHRASGRSVKVVAVDDCGVRINPMIVEGQIMGGLTEGYAIAAMELITFDEDGNCIGSNFMDYLLPTAWETPEFELGETVTPSPHHPLGAKGVGESATVGSPAAYVNAVIDALAHAGVRNIDMPRDLRQGLGRRSQEVGLAE